MKKYLKFIRIAIISIIIVIVIAVSWLMFFQINKVKQSFNSLIEQADSFIGSGYFDSAAELLKEAHAFARRAVEHLKVLKGFLVLADSTGNWSEIEKYSFLSWQKMPGNDEIVFIASYAALRNNNFPGALNIYKNHKDDERYKGILSEIALSDKNVEINEKPAILNLLNSNDPALFEEWASLENDPRLYINSALLYMQEGNKDKAMELIFDNLKNTSDYDELKALIAYDSGRPEPAIHLIKNLILRGDNHKREDLSILLADLYLLFGEYEPAKRLYKDIILLTPVISSKAFLNLSWILQLGNDNESAYKILKKGLNDFPGNINITKELVLLMIKLGEKSLAEQLLLDSIHNNPEEVEAQLLFLVITMENLLAPKWSRAVFRHGCRCA